MLGDRQRPWVAELDLIYKMFERPHDGRICSSDLNHLLNPTLAVGSCVIRSLYTFAHSTQ